MKNLLLGVLFCLVCGITHDAYGKDPHKILMEHRTDISPDVIKIVKKWGNDPIFHDSWIENPWGKSVDLQGNELFPNIAYRGCREISPVLFELKAKNVLSHTGLVRSDGTIIIPLKHKELLYYPQIGIIVGVNDKIYQGEDKGFIYTYGGTLIEEIPEATYFYVSGGKLHYSKGIGKENREIEIPEYVIGYTPTELENIAAYYYKGAQAVTFNIISKLCASEKKSDHDDAMTLMRYFVDNIMPEGEYYKKRSLLLWELRYRYLAMMLMTKVNNKRMEEATKYFEFAYHESLFTNGYKPSIGGYLSSEVAKSASKETLDMIAQTEKMFDEAVEICRQKVERKAALNAALLAGLQAMSQATMNMNQTTKTSTNSSYKATNSSTVTQQTNLPAQQKVSSAKPDNAGRKALLRGEIATWRNKLKKAQQSYNQAMSSGEDTPQKKRVLESKQKTIDTCLEMINQYERELNSLQ